MRDRQEAAGRFAENLLGARRRAALSQEDLAKRAQISKGYVSRLEDGGTEIEWQPGEDRTGAYGPSD